MSVMLLWTGLYYLFVAFIWVALLLLLGGYLFLYRGINSTSFRLGMSVWIWGFLITVFRSYYTNLNMELTLPGSEFLFDQRMVKAQDIVVIFKYFVVLGGLVYLVCLLIWYVARKPIKARLSKDICDSGEEMHRSWRRSGEK